MPDDSELENQGIVRRTFHAIIESVREALPNIWARLVDAVRSPEAFPQGLKYIAGATIGISVLVVILLVLFYRPGGAIGADETGKPTAVVQGGTSGSAGSPGGTILSWISTPIDPDRYLVPRQMGFSDGLRLSRMPRNKWDGKDVSRFWIDPRTLVIEHLEKRNEALIDSVLGHAR